MPRTTDPTHDVRLTDRPAVEVVAVALQGDAEDRNVLERAMATAAAHRARLLVVAPYEPATARELSRAHRDAPTDVLSDINPVAEVEGLLHRAATTATSRGLPVTTVAAPDRGRRTVHRAAVEHGADLLVGAFVPVRPLRAPWASRLAGASRRDRGASAGRAGARDLSA